MLLKQDRSEAVLAVDGRLEFIDKEMYEFSPVSCSTSAPEREFSFCCSRKTEPRRANAIFVSVVGSAECSKRVEKQIQDMQTKSENTKMEVRFLFLFSQPGEEGEGGRRRTKRVKR